MQLGVLPLGGLQQAGAQLVPEALQWTQKVLARKVLARKVQWEWLVQELVR